MFIKKFYKSITRLFCKCSYESEEIYHTHKNKIDSFVRPLFFQFFLGIPVKGRDTLIYFPPISHIVYRKFF
jgi:hypothetical protein